MELGLNKMNFAKQLKMNLFIDKYKAFAKRRQSFFFYAIIEVSLAHRLFMSVSISMFL